MPTYQESVKLKSQVRQPRHTKSGSEANKENLPPQETPYPKQFVNNNVGSSLSMSNEQLPQNKARLPSTNKGCRLLYQHPLSKHILKPNLYNDEGWIRQQQTIFTAILNEVLTVHESQSKIWHSEVIESVRSTAFQLYQANAFQVIVRRLGVAFETETLTLIHQTQCLRDVGLKFQIKKLLCSSYNPQWLCLGMELITGRTLNSTLQTNQLSLFSFIDNFVLDNVDISHHNLSETSSRDRASIRNLFVLVYTLDYLKNVLRGPSLFLSDSNLKSSIDVARKLSSLCLAREGDIGRRLQSITKAQLTHSQYPLDDFDYRIGNLATDLRDGIRLTRLLEIWARRDDCSQQLRYPANGMLQKKHNLSIAFTAIQAEGINISMENGKAITPCDIATGDRERTLFLLWRLIGHWQLPRYLETIHLGEEIRYLKKLLTIRGIATPTVKILQYSDAPYMDQLLEWAALVSSASGKPIHDFTTSFVNDDPFYRIIDFYFPRAPPDVLIRGQGHLFKTFERTSTKDLLDIRVIIAILAFLASRTLVDNDQIKAARIIQRVFRSSIEQNDCMPLRRRQAAQVLQRAYRRHREHRAESLLNTVIIIQALARGFLFRLRWRRRALQDAFEGFHSFIGR